MQHALPEGSDYAALPFPSGAVWLPRTDAAISIAPVRDYCRVALGLALQIGDVGLQLLGFEPRCGLGVLTFFEFRVRRMRPVAGVLVLNGCSLNQGSGMSKATAMR